MKDGLYGCFVHGIPNYFKFVKGRPYQADYNAKLGYYWRRTVVCKERQLHMIELSSRIQDEPNFFIKLKIKIMKEYRRRKYAAH